MPDKHLSSEFDADLGAISNRVMEMGRLVESQFAQAMVALSSFSPELATQVLEREALVNRMEVEIDRELSGVIARHQPAARDLRWLIAVSKAIANLERVGDARTNWAWIRSRGCRPPRPRAAWHSMGRIRCMGHHPARLGGACWPSSRTRCSTC